MYLSYSETNTLDFSSNNISKLYSKGNLFTRKTKGNLYQTRSLRINLLEFELSSENKRILNKNSYLTFLTKELPFVNYNWHVHSLGKEFYSTKFGDKTFTASKIKEMATDVDKSNMNLIFQYNLKSPSIKSLVNEFDGYAICYQNLELLHYAYPFYNLTVAREQNIGMAMMLNAILWAKDNAKRYIYLGSVADAASKYKLQFKALEWWNNEDGKWSNNIELLKTLIS